ncbi:hypothetical protein IWX65_000470 [Arthrobacter sp. CAN_A214]|uniref:hypothetical protein n=1 Tax=Arthrobacter sp. CAN_A214 TaxID=2787720 RepID=UPI0018CBE50D
MSPQNSLDAPRIKRIAAIALAASISVGAVAAPAYANHEDGGAVEEPGSDQSDGVQTEEQRAGEEARQEAEVERQKALQEAEAELLKGQRERDEQQGPGPTEVPLPPSTEPAPETVPPTQAPAPIEPTVPTPEVTEAAPPVPAEAEPTTEQPASPPPPPPAPVLNIPAPPPVPVVRAPQPAPAVVPQNVLPAPAPIPEPHTPLPEPVQPKSLLGTLYDQPLFASQPGLADQVVPQATREAAPEAQAGRIQAQGQLEQTSGLQRGTQLILLAAGVLLASAAGVIGVSMARRRTPGSRQH